WASIGPASTPDWRYLDAPTSDRRGVAAGWLWVASRAIRLGCRGVALETFVDPEEAEDAVRTLRAALPVTPIVASLVVRDDGLLHDGSSPREHVERLVALGATGAGFGCGDGPRGVVAAVARCGDTNAPLWAKPAAGAGAADELADILRG